MKSRRICKIGSSFPYQDDIDQEETIPVQWHWRRKLHQVAESPTKCTNFTALSVRVRWKIIPNPIYNAEFGSGKWKYSFHATELPPNTYRYTYVRSYIIRHIQAYLYSNFGIASLLWADCASSFHGSFCGGTRAWASLGDSLANCPCRSLAIWSCFAIRIVESQRSIGGPLKHSIPPKALKFKTRASCFSGPCSARCCRLSVQVPILNPNAWSVL